MKFKKALFNMALIVAALALLSIAAMAQNSFVTTLNYPPQNHFESEGRPLQCSDGGFLVMGTARWQDTASNHYTAMLVAKLDSTGTMVWSKSYTNNSSGNIFAAAETPAGFLLAGYLWRTGLIENSVVLINTDQNGDTLWTRKYENMGGLYSIKPMPNGDFVCTGYHSGLPAYHPQVMRIDAMGNILWRKEYNHQPIVGFGNRNGYVCSDGSIIFYFQSMIMVKLDTAGNYVWSLPRYNFVNTLWSTDIVEMGDSSYLVVGHMTLPGRGEDGVVSKISPSGSVVWVKYVGNAATNERIYSAEKLADGSVILNGEMDDTPNQANPSNWALQMDTAGNVLWSKRFYGLPDAVNWGGLHVKDGPYIGGFISSGLSYDSIAGYSSLLAIRNMFDTTSCLMHDAPVNTDTLSIPGSTAINVTSITTPYAEFDTAIYVTSTVLVQDYYCSTSTGIHGVNTGNSSLADVYPNPFYDRVRITASGNKKIDAIEIWDVAGKLLLEFKDFNGGEIHLNTISSGIYFMHVTVDGKQVVKKLLKE